MNPYQLSFFTLFIIVAYFVATDESVATYVNLIFAGAWLQVRRYYYMAILHPKNPITNWIMERKMKKLAKELSKEYGLIEDEE